MCSKISVVYRSDFYPGIVTANGKKVVAADVKADNGIIHIIEDALYPLPQPSFIEILSNDPMFVRGYHYTLMRSPIVPEVLKCTRTPLFDNVVSQSHGCTFQVNTADKKAM